MFISKQHISPSPKGRNWLRFEFQVTVDRKSQQLAYWVDFPAYLRDDLSAFEESGNWQAVFLTPLGSYFDEPIRIEAPTDRRLLDNLRGVSQIWASWRNDFQEVTFVADSSVQGDKGVREPSQDKKTVACFSGGIDSMFTLLRHDDEVFGDGSRKIDELFCLAGFNTSMEDIDFMSSHLGKIVGQLGREVIPFVTNIRYGEHELETPYSVEELMCGVAHGCALAVFPHLFSRRYREMIIPSTHTYDSLIAWGSHPLTDRLLSSATLDVVHDGATFGRIAKTELVASNEAYLDLMHVCWIDLALGNCSICEKCIRTMLTLDLLGLKGKGAPFDWRKYSMRRVSRAILKDDNAKLYFLEILEKARELGRNDIVEAVENSLLFSAKYERKQKIKGVLRPLLQSIGFSGNAYRLYRTSFSRKRKVAV